MAAETILGQIAIQGFSGLLSNLASEYVRRPDRKIKTDEGTIKTDLSDHLTITFNKCMNVKTILNSDSSSRTLEIYVDQSFKVERKSIDQYSLIDSIRCGNSIIIVGAGGGGKSMFMRYLWLSYFEKSDGKIPFFLELRHLNSVSHKDMGDFIYHSIIKSGSTIKQSDFSRAMRSGEFIVFLDGFDEIHFDKREIVQSMILELRQNNPNLVVVVTSRPDERFIGWDGFVVAHVEALSPENSRLLIERSDYNAELKAKFLARFDRLFSLHQDFLTNPLLAYMMLVTFSYNPDIPRRMFQFYEQAFEALYHRHDLTKGYKRTFHCALDKMDFIRLTAYFCLKTYYDEVVEFSRDEVLTAIEQAKSIEGIDVNSEHFLDDLTQSVCLLKMEGLHFAFTHRSFQEYFSAYCIARVAIREVEKLFSRFASRYTDQVLPMVADISADLFREKYIVPRSKRFASFIHRKTDRKLYESFSTKVGAVFSLEIRSPRVKGSRPKKFRSLNRVRDYHISLHYEGEMFEFFKVVEGVVDNRRMGRLSNSERSDEGFYKRVKALLPNFEGTIFVFVASGRIRVSSNQTIADNVISESDEEALVDEFRNSRMFEFIEDRAVVFLEFVRRELASYSRVSAAFIDIF